MTPEHEHALERLDRSEWEKERLAEMVDCLREDLREAEACIAECAKALEDVLRARGATAVGHDTFWVGETSFVLCEKALKLAQEQLRVPAPNPETVSSA